jgi:2-C-methyl-D-erythritol 4-phosphate cytidylyltransferase
VQTPQCFNFQLIKAAYNQPFNHNFTDDASVIELLNEKINLVEGNTENIKITTATDLIIAECLLNNLKD